jgi:signal transduction histidine kinase
VLVCAEAFVLAFWPGTTLVSLARPSAALLLLALCAACFAFSHARAMVQEITGLCAQARSPMARLSVLPHARFREVQRLREELDQLLNAVRSGEASRDAERSRTEAPLELRIRFVAAMGHDLRTPLNHMLGFADLLAIDRSSTWNAQQLRSLAILRDRTRDLLGLMDDMVDWAKLESGELALTPRACSVLSVIERALHTAKERSGARGLRASVELEPGLPEVWVDEARTAQALLGLMDNAARSEGAPELLVRAMRRPGATQSNPRAGQLVVEVIDPQLEVREPDRVQLFRAFRPSFAPSGRRIAGLHLGTSMARALIRAQGGDVWFESRPERGTTFMVALPTATDAARSRSAAV